MRAIRFHEYGGPDVLRIDEVPDPSPGAGQLLVGVRAVGVNFIEIYNRTGAYPSSLPHIPGTEGAGEVLGVGPGVTGFAPGDRVAFSAARGSYAEQTLTPARVTFRLPDELSYESGAALALQGPAAHALANSVYPIRQGDWALVHAAAGGIGLLTVQMLKMRGARVIGTVSTEEKAEIAREAGADEVIIYGTRGFVQDVRRITGGEGAHVVYDSVGMDTFNGSLDSLRSRGLMVLFGQSSGPVPPIDPQLLNRKGSLFLTRPNLPDYSETREEFEWRYHDVYGWAASGALNVRIGLCLPLAEAAEAHRRLQGRETTGKVVLLP